MRALNEINGYKSFIYPLQNLNGMSFEVGKIYRTDGDVTFGTQSHYGFHLCQRMEDTLKYFHNCEEEIEICDVIGRGTIIESFDKYYDFDNLYAVSELEIVKRLNWQEIWNMVNNLDTNNHIDMYRLKRFLELCRLTKEEIDFFIKKFKDSYHYDIINTINYYQIDTEKNDIKLAKICRKIS